MYPRHLSPAPLSLRRFSDLNLRFIAAGLLVGLVLCATARFARAQNASSPGSSSAALRLTRDLVTLNARYHRAGSVERVRLMNDLLTAASERRQLLASLIEDSPGEVLQAAIPTAIRANLPAAVRGYVEQEVETEGELEVMYEDRESESRLLFFLKNAGERLSLHFAANAPDAISGARIHVSGLRVG
jgi:hypothetical protein